MTEVKDTVRAAYGDLAKAGAKKLCAYGNCIFHCYNCGHQKAKLGGSPSLLNPNAVCPVARYQVEDQGEIGRNAMRVSLYFPKMRFLPSARAVTKVKLQKPLSILRLIAQTSRHVWIARSKQWRIAYRKLLRKLE